MAKELKGTQTEKNLWTAFAGESQARNKYDYFASKAKKDGYDASGSCRSRGTISPSSAGPGGG